MALESVTHIDDLDATNPVGTDPRSEGDDHIRNIKTVLLTDFAGITGVVTATHSELNYTDVTAGTLTASKAIVVDSSSKIDNLKVDNIDINGNAIISTDSNGDVTITPNGSGDLILDGLKWPQADGTANYLLKTNGSAQLSWVENLAEDWANKTDGTVSGSEYSAKAYAIGGTGVTDTSGKGAAKEWATAAEDDTVDGSEYSAKHYSVKGAASASAASTSASTATTKATAAASSATAAASSATAAASSASAGATSATAAAASATAAAASADAFDDLYLGAKSSDPSTDNDGDALSAGDLYFNTSSDTLEVYTGSAWETAALSSSGFATVAGTQTLTNKTLTSPNVGTALNLLEDTTIIFEGATDDGYETTLTVVDPTADRTVSIPNATDTLVGKATTDTLTNKTLTSPVLNTGVSGTAVKDEDNMASDSATHLATQQSIKAYIHSQTTTGLRLVFGF